VEQCHVPLTFYRAGSGRAAERQVENGTLSGQLGQPGGDPAKRYRIQAILPSLGTERKKAVPVFSFAGVDDRFVPTAPPIVGDTDDDMQRIAAQDPVLPSKRRTTERDRSTDEVPGRRN
jgi:hypothetical protein